MRKQNKTKSVRRAILFRLDPVFVARIQKVADAQHRSLQSVVVEAAERGLPAIESAVAA
jgi:predicted transcriptional regulator